MTSPTQGGSTSSVLESLVDVIAASRSRLNTKGRSSFRQASHTQGFGQTRCIGWVLEWLFRHKVSTREVWFHSQTFSRADSGVLHVGQPGIATGHKCGDAICAAGRMVERRQGLPIPLQDHLSLTNRSPVPGLFEVWIDLLGALEPRSEE